MTITLRSKLLELLVALEGVLERDQLIVACRVVDLEGGILRRWVRLVEAAEHTRTHALSPRILAIRPSVISSEADIACFLCDRHAELGVVDDGARTLAVYLDCAILE